MNLVLFGFTFGLVVLPEVTSCFSEKYIQQLSLVETTLLHHSKAVKISGIINQTATVVQSVPGSVGSLR